MFFNKLKLCLIILFYNVCLWIYLITYLAVLLITFQRNKIKTTIRNNLYFCSKKQKINTKSCIWFHAASVGESLLAFLFVKDLITKYPDFSILVTTCTESSEKLWKDEFKDKIIYRTLPYDIKYIAKNFINCFSIKLAIFIEADFWPNFLFTLKNKKIPLLLFNGRMSTKSFNRWLKAKFFISEILNTFSFIGAESLQSLKYITNFVSKNKVKYFGNLKYLDQHISNFNNQEYINISKVLSNKVVLLALSTHSPEEEMIANIYTKLKNSIPNLFIILIPRHVERTKDIIISLEKLNLNTQVFSKKYIPQENTDIYLVDTFGQTSMFCKMANITYIGKSMFKGASGGHNLLEPLREQSAVIFGPYMNNFLEIVNAALQQNAAVQVDNPEELLETINNLLKNNVILKNMRKNAKLLVKSHADIKNNYLKIIDYYLET